MDMKWNEQDVLHSSGTTSNGQMRQRSTCTRVMGREECGEGKELLMIQSIPPHQWSMVVVVSWCGHVWLPMELVLLYLLMMWLLTKAAGWILKCFGQYYLLILSQMLQNSLDGASQCRWTMTRSILRKQPKSFFKGKKLNVMQWLSQSPDLNPIEHAFHLLKTKLKGKCPKNKQELKTVAVEAWQSITRASPGRKASVWWCLCVPDFRL